MGPFALGAEGAGKGACQHPETRLCLALQTWREETVAGSGDLNTTDLEGSHARSSLVFKHAQYTASEQAPALAGQRADDCYSPTNAGDYIRLRLLPAQAFYQERIQPNVRIRLFLQLLVLVCSALSAGLAYFGRSEWVPLITAVGAAVTSWMEYRGLVGKIERHSAAARAIKNLFSWWISLGEVAQAIPENISRLILSGESIITDEFQAWSATTSSVSVSLPGYSCD